LGFLASVDRPELLPTADEMDAEHRRWRGIAVDCAKEFDLTLTHGVAAKLINVYMKAAFVCGGYASHPHACALHPPIDRLMLNELGTRTVGGIGKRWRDYARRAWSTFDGDTYESVIADLRRVQKDRPLWMVEEHWRGHQ
jgi:hypothetical protein